MNENLNLVEILKDCPQGTKLYSLIYGDVELVNVLQGEDVEYPIEVKLDNNLIETFTNGGRLLVDYDGECVLFPSKDQRDWSKFKVKTPKFDPKTLQSFDKVLVRDSDSENWMIQLFSHIIEDEAGYPYLCINNPYKYCIPYNNDTKHLVGVNEEAPEYYRYWGD